ncbi:MAG: hypothetical protein K0R18_1392 [Bacillales bacterium]|jgi:hypothetical protein|nr:hypothetical protein [Bacillales bacterium]
MPPRRNSFLRRSQKSNPFVNMFGEGPGGLLSLFSGQQSSKSGGLFGGRLGSQSNVGAISGMISNTQKAIDAVQKVAPVVQQAKQYGPLLRNLPSMYKLLKEIKSPSDDINSNEEVSKDSDLEEKITVKSKQVEKIEKIEKIETCNPEFKEKKSLPMYFMPGTRK